MALIYQFFRSHLGNEILFWYKEVVCSVDLRNELKCDQDIAIDRIQ